MGNSPTQTLAQIFLICLLLFIAVPMMSIITGAEDHEEPKAVEAWPKRVGHAKQKVTKLHFYFHDTFSGKNPTTTIVAKADTSLTSSTLFGAVFVMDDPLTVGPELNSKIIGRAQGLYSMDDQQELEALMCMTCLFTEGKFNGSTLSILGKNPMLHEYREMPVLSGTGVFRLAGGVATAKTYSFNATSGNAVVEYNVVVIHY